MEDVRRRLDGHDEALNDQREDMTKIRERLARMEVLLIVAVPFLTAGFNYMFGLLFKGH